MIVTNQTSSDIYFGPLHLGAGVGTQLTVDDTSATSLYLTSDAVADALNNAYNAGKVTVSSQAQPFPRPTGVPQILHGDGNPEGLVYASQGSIYMRRDATGGAVLYAKTTGITLSTGWQVYSFQATPIQVIDLTNWPPSTPTDGQQALLRLPSSYDPVGGKKLCWGFVYDAAASQWTFSGGPPLYNEVQTNELVASTGYGDNTTVGPAITLPRNGDYQLTVGHVPITNGAGTSSAFMAYSGAGITASDNDAAIGVVSNVNDSPAFSVSRTRYKTALTSGTVTAKYRYGSNQPNTEYRWITAVPVRIN
jgi:hypothetical protein